MADAFISYSRKDKDFVSHLYKALQEHNRAIWVDWEDIPPAAPWRKEIYDGIEAADAFIFVISPDSVASSYCCEEITYAVKHNKRLIPIVHRKVASTDVVESLRSLNWIYFRDDNFDSALQTLIKAIDTHLEHVRTHTRLLIRAIEWDKKGRDSSFLLRGSALADAEQWLIQDAQKEPNPTNLHREYISASLTAETASLIYRSVFLYFNKLSTLVANIRTSKKQLFFLPIEGIIYLVATVNILLVIFDITYIFLRNFYVLKIPSITQVYDPVNGIETERDTQQYLQRVEELKAVARRNGLQSTEVESILQDLRRRSEEMIDINPFQASGLNKKSIGTLEKLKNRIRQHVFHTQDAPAKESFRRFWSQSYLRANGFEEELSFFRQNIQPTLEANYYRGYDENGQLRDYFWTIDCLFIPVFAIELLLRTLYLCQKLNIPFIKALGTRWYDFFWFTFTVYWAWLRLLRLIPYAVRSYQVGVLEVRILRIKLRATRIASLREEQEKR
jgi:hypothetical protein